MIHARKNFWRKKAGQYQAHTAMKQNGLTKHKGRGPKENFFPINGNNRGCQGAGQRVGKLVEEVANYKVDQVNEEQLEVDEHWCFEIVAKSPGTA